MKIPQEVLIQCKGIKSITEDEKKQFDDLLKKPEDEFISLLPEYVQKEFIISATESQIIGDLLDKIDVVL